MRVFGLADGSLSHVLSHDSRAHSVGQVKWYHYQVSWTKLQQNCRLFMSEVKCLKVVYSSYVYISSYDYKSFIYDLNIVSFEDSENKF